MSYMGQILRQLDQPTFKKDNKLAYTLNEVANLQDIPPFTLYCQKRIVQTDLATQLINIQVGNEYALTQLLAKHNITVTFQDQG